MRLMCIVTKKLFSKNVFAAISMMGCFVLFFGQRGYSATEDPFPSYGCIEDNIDFWKKVYVSYPSTKGIVHDSWDLSIIYEVIDLLGAEVPGARKINRERAKLAKKKYRQILLDLATGMTPITKEKQRVKDLWRVKATDKDLREAAESVRLQNGISDKFQQGLVRSGRYLTVMQDVFREYDLPVDLAYLPHVESSFNYEAYSKFGAAGIWQFIRSTGRRFLEINYIVDERRDPIRATRAAARYLKENHDKLDDWPLAVTAYNYGANGMLKAKNMFGCFDRVYGEYNQRRFGFASRNFYAEFLAAREIAKNYQKYFKGLRLDPPVSAYGVELLDYYAIEDLAGYFETPISMIKQLNPGLRKPVYVGEKYVPKGYQLQLPQDEAVIARAGEIPPRLARPNQKRSRFYRVRRGDTAGRIANMHKVKLRDLIERNGLNRQARIFIGQNLILPQVGEKVTASGQILRETSKRRPPVVARLTRDKEEKEKRVAAAVIPASLDTSSEYSPAKSFAAKEGVKSTAEAEQAAEMAPADLGRNPDAILGNFQVADVQGSGSRKVGYITVEAMETLGHYADWLEVKTRKIRRLNSLVFGRHIKTSQRIKIPLHKVAKFLFEERRYEFHRGIEEDFFESYAVTGTETYKVKYGDNIWDVCRNELDLPFWLLKKYNGTVNFDVLQQNQILVVPIVENNG